MARSDEMPRTPIASRAPQARLAVLTLALLACLHAQAAQPSTSSRPAASFQAASAPKETSTMADDQTAAGFKAIIHHGQLLHSPAVLPEGSTNDVTYELGICFQLDRTHCLLVCNMDEAGGPDLCVGNDGFVFEKLSDIRAGSAIPISRPETAFRLKNGQIGYLAKYPVTGAFVPLGAVLPDGSPHPAAGTGLIVAACRAYPSDRHDVAHAAPPTTTGEDWKSYQTFMEVTQYRWDGRGLTVTGRQQGEDWLGMQAIGKPLTPLCPAGAGFVAPFIFDADHKFRTVRFDFDGQAWRPTALGEPFLTADGECEPGIHRDGEGFIVHTRGRDQVGRVYRSGDGMNFELAMSHPNWTVPQGFNKGLDGSFYVATNTGPGFLRNPLEAFPVGPDSLGPPMIVHDQGGVRTDTGERIPFIDHGVGVNVFLEGRWRHLLFYRVCDLKERTLYGHQKDVSQRIHGDRSPIPKLPTSGTYVAELIYDRVTDPPWRFAD